MTSTVGYARPGPGLPALPNQVEQLRRAGCVDIHQERAVSRANPVASVLKLARRLQQGDSVVVVSLRVISGPLPDVCAAMTTISKLGVRLISLTEHLATVPSGRLPLGPPGLTDQAQPSDHPGVNNPGPIQGQKPTPTRKPGRKPALTPNQILEAKRFNAEGRSLAYIADLFEVSRTTIHRALNSR